jgi:hypothetical protein
VLIKKSKEAKDQSGVSRQECIKSAIQADIVQKIVLEILHKVIYTL